MAAPRSRCSISCARTKSVAPMSRPRVGCAATMTLGARQDAGEEYLLYVAAGERANPVVRIPLDREPVDQVLGVGLQRALVERAGVDLAALWPCCLRHASSLKTHSCRSMPPTPSGFSWLWSGPAAKPSSEMERWNLNLLIEPPRIRWLGRGHPRAIHPNRPRLPAELIARPWPRPAELAGMGPVGLLSASTTSLRPMMWSVDWRAFCTR